MLFLFLVGLVLLVLGADLLVRGASRLAVAAGIPPLVVGLTVVAFGTSAPELAVSASSALSGQAEVAVGNVVGSNIFNVLFILGLSALITPLAVEQQLIRRDVPLMILCSGVAFACAVDGTIGRLEGAGFVLALTIYTFWCIRAGRRESRAPTEAVAPATRTRSATWLFDVVLVVAGLALLVLGAHWLVEATTRFARALGVSEVIVGLTIVAAGTSLPEVATSVVAAVRGQRDIAVGNVIGSNLFNLMGVLGVSGMVAPTGLPVPASVLAFDLPVMIAVAIACLPIFATGHRINRWEGALFLAYYVAYTIYLALSATGHDALTGYSWVMTTFVLPITTITIVVVAGRSWRRWSRDPTRR
ncbi:MAG: calcium/sodium antiporter [Planctomycetes bacterium]|nr:calcium/sodium antiporter [Planctomycetota bacterium]MCB9891009.1 calcium/sodium antiporter [Planctomycetota bacterium]MCB9919138.1 calcium/sodium antiporter [Planctomycetota bacterium]